MYESIINNIEELNKQHDNVIPIFGGAIHAYKYAETDFARFVDYLPGVINSARIYNWHENEADTVRRFCHLCSVDPALVESYLGIKLDTLINHDYKVNNIDGENYAAIAYEEIRPVQW